MDASTFRAVHRYGAVLSVGATAGAVLAYAVGGPLRPLVFPLGLFGPLGCFYFVGAVLEDHPTYAPVGEELLRGVVWYGASLFGWSFVLSSSSALPATPATALGLPAVTALVLSLAMVGVRRATGLDLRVRSEGGQLLVLVTGVLTGGALVLYAVLVEGRSPLIVPLFVLAAAAGALVWRRNRRGSPTDA